MERIEIAKILTSPQEYAEKTITVCGWVKSIRDSKALGFIDLNDGSSFAGLQVVFEAQNVENFAEIAKQNVGAALCVTGTLVPTPEAKQPCETDCGGSGLRARISSAKETPFCGIPAHHRASAPAYQSVQRRVSCALCGGLCHSPFLSGAQLRLRQYAADHRQRLRGGRGDVPRHHARPGQPAPV